MQRVDLLAQMLYLVLTVLCIFYLIVITIDWYDGVIRLGDTFIRQIAIDGRYRDFPIWSFVIPSIVLMAWKIMTILRNEQVSRAAALGQGALVRPPAGLRRQPRLSCAWTGRSAGLGRCCPRSLLSSLLIFWAVVAAGDRGRDQAPRRRRAAASSRPTAAAG